MRFRSVPMLAATLISCHAASPDLRSRCERAIRNGSDAPDLAEISSIVQVSPSSFKVLHRPYNGRREALTSTTCSFSQDRSGATSGWLTDDHGRRKQAW